MRNFTDTENVWAYLACNGLRAAIVIFEDKAALDDPQFNDNEKVVENFGMDSRIYALMCRYDWQKLFLDDDWQNLLRVAEKLNILLGGRLNEHLKMIAKYFLIEVVELSGFRPPVSFMH